METGLKRVRQSKENMHLGKFHHAVTNLIQDYGDHKIADRLQDVINRLDELVANPGNTDVAVSFKSQLEALRVALGRSTLNSPHPTLLAMLKSINAELFIGDSLFSMVEEQLASNGMTPQLASAALKKIQIRLADFYRHVSAVDASFSALGVEYEDIDEGEGEIGISIPTPDGRRTLIDLSKSAKRWNIALAPFVEIFDPDHNPIVVRTISSSDWQFYLNAAVPVLLGLSYCISQINVVLEKLIETKKLVILLKSKGVSDDAVAPVIEEADKFLETDTRALAEKVLNENCVIDDEGRANELKTSLTLSLKFIAREIAADVTLEVRYVPPEPANHVDGAELSAAEAAEVERINSLVETAAQILRNMDLIKLDGLAAGKLNLPAPEEMD
jgi:hypothetical protein